jgi:hypothetical protein
MEAAYESSKGSGMRAIRARSIRKAVVTGLVLFDIPLAPVKGADHVNGKERRTHKTMKRLYNRGQIRLRRV